MPVSRRQFCKIAAGGAAAFGGRNLCRAASEKVTGKNVLVIMTDEQRWDSLGAAGVFPDVKTPNIDRLAREGTYFTHCYTPNPLSCPARVSMWTGRMPHSHHVIGNWRALRPELRDAGLVRKFAEAGYHTIYTGKWHVPGTTPDRFHFRDSAAIPAVVNGRDRGRFIREYREYVSGRGYRLLPHNIENMTVKERDWYKGRRPLYGESEIPMKHSLETWVTGELLKTIDRRPKQKPFFAVVSYSAPHFPMIVPAPFNEAVNPYGDVLPENLMEGKKGKAREVLRSRFHCRNVKRRHWAQLTAHYHGFCTMVDNLVGRITSHLSAIGELDNTIVVYTSDHGDMLGSHGFNKKGYHLHYEEACRVPLIIRDPSIAGGGRCSRFVTLSDILPTLAELCEVDLREKTDGRSFAGLVVDPQGPAIRDHVVAESFLVNGCEGGRGKYSDPRSLDFAGKDSVNLSVRTEKDRYIFRFNDRDEYYDRVEDPDENRNCIDVKGYGERISRCRELLLAEVRAGLPEALSAVRDRLG